MGATSGQFIYLWPDVLAADQQCQLCRPGLLVADDMAGLGRTRSVC
jgi:hypothetical protein